MRLKLIGAICLAFTGLLAYDQYDKYTNYRPVQARVSEVNEQCYMEKREFGILSRSTSTSGLLDCTVATQLVQVHPAWQGYDVKHKIEVGFFFTSPVDGRAHSSKLQMTAFPDNKPLQVGDVFVVRASRTSADQTRAA